MYCDLLSVVVVPRLPRDAKVEFHAIAAEEVSEIEGKEEINLSYPNYIMYSVRISDYSGTLSRHSNDLIFSRKAFKSLSHQSK